MLKETKSSLTLRRIENMPTWWNGRHEGLECKNLSA